MGRMAHAGSRAVTLTLFLASCGVSPPGRDAPPPPPPATATAVAAITTAKAPPEPPAPPPRPEPVRVRFLSVGDVIFGRRVQRTIDAKGDPEHPFRPLAKLYAAVDFTFANLENPFFSGKKPNETPPGKRYAVLWAKPEHVSTLVKYKVTAVNLANNHAMDQDLRGLEETLATLDAAGVQHVGVGKDLAAAWKPMFVDVRGLKIGFVGASFTSKNDMGFSRNPHVARIEDEDRLAAACGEARQGAHFVVVTMHAGDEHKLVPNAKQRAFAKAAVRAGADVVIGAHPHVVQPAEKIDGKWVFYSLGNFVFDQAAPENKEAVAVELHLALQPGAKLAAMEKILLHPVVIDEAAPGPADEARAAKILTLLGAPGRELEP
jgi:hypothetical protein